MFLLLLSGNSSHTANCENPGASALSHIADREARSPATPGPPPPNPAHSSAIMDASCRVPFLLDARSKFSVSINH